MSTTAIHDLFEITGMPEEGMTIGLGGSGSDVKFTGTEATANVVDDLQSSDQVNHQGGFHVAATSSASWSQEVDIDGTGFTVQTINEAQASINGGPPETVYLISMSVSGDPSDVRHFFLPPDAMAATELESVEVISLTPLTFLDADTVGGDESHSFKPCFTHGTRIATPTGSVAIEEIGVGSMVLTLDHGPQPVIWVGDLVDAPGSDARTEYPVTFAAGALGQGRPARRLRLSPLHRVALCDPTTAASREVLAHAKHLVGHPGITSGPAPVIYRHILLAQHSLVWAEGMAVETLWLGPMAARSLGLSAYHAAVRALGRRGTSTVQTPARPFLTRRAVRTLRQKTVRLSGVRFHPAGQPARAG